MNSPALPFDEIAGRKLNSEQTAYLEGLFAGLRNRGLTFAQADPESAPAIDSKSHAPSDDLIPEERIKKELHPLDSYSLLLQHASANQAPDKEQTFRFKWHGLFFLSPHTDAYMARLRIPGGQLKSYQLRELASIAEQLTSGYIQITTRANLQIRLIEPKNTIEFLRRIQAIGLHTRGSGADNIRNITCDPTSGLDPSEWIETLPLAQELGQFILNHREFYDLPRKFNVAFHGGGPIPTVEDTNDIGLKAVRVVPAAPTAPGTPYAPTLVTDQVPPGVYFTCALGGATGHKTFARDAGILIRPDQTLSVVAALIRVFIAHGNRTDRKKARLKHLLESWTVDQYLAETEKRLGWSLLRIPNNAQYLTAPQPASPSHPHVGVFRQTQPGLNWIGATTPVGQLTARQLRRLAELSELYGNGELRLTVWQSFILPNIPDALVGTVQKALQKLGFDTAPSHLKSGFVACTGNSHCKFASSNTKGHALELMRWLDRRVQLDRPINIHLTGCPNSCAQHYMGDIGLLATKVKLAGESVEGYHVFVGGGFGSHQAVGRQLFTGISFESLKPTLERLLLNFQKHRIAGESFLAFTQRHDLGSLQMLLGEELPAQVA